MLAPGHKSGRQCLINLRDSLVDGNFLHDRARKIEVVAGRKNHNRVRYILLRKQPPNVSEFQGTRRVAVAPPYNHWKGRALGRGR
jgi:hypothetical protein